MLEKIEGVSFQEAMTRVKEEVGDIDSWQRDKSRVENVFHSVSEKKTFRTISLSSFAKFENDFDKSVAAVEWMKSRGISLDTAKKFHVGYLQSIGKLAGEAGADIADGGWLVFPYVDGDLIRLSKFRSLVRKKPGGFARQPGMETVLYHSDTIDPFEPVYLTSGEFDAMTLEQAGFRAVSLASDTHKPTPEQKDQLMGASVVILAGDTDSVGSDTMNKLWAELKERVYKLTWPENTKDANDCFLKHCKGDVQLFKALVENLTHKAKLQPMPSVYSLQEVLLNGEDVGLADRPDRLRMPWPTADKMLVVLPGHVLGLGSTNTGMGKTMAEVQISLHNAVKYGRTVLNFQAEMSPSEIAVLVASQTLKKHRNLLTKEDMAAVAETLSGIQYYVGRDPNITELGEALDLLEAAVRRLSPDITVFDHFHHFSAGANNENQVQAAGAARIKQISEMYGTIFINVGQPRKANQQTKGKKIHITDFKGSGAWGDAANAVLVIHRDLNKLDDVENAKGPYEDKTLLQVLKGRSLGMGSSACYLTCFGEYCCFEEIEHNYEEGTE